MEEKGFYVYGMDFDYSAQEKVYKMIKSGSLERAHEDGEYWVAHNDSFNISAKLIENGRTILFRAYVGTMNNPHIIKRERVMVGW